MSDILIHGMEMPEEGWHKVIKIFSDGTVVSYYDSVTLAKAIPVPDHGRLIDENWLKNAMITTLEALKNNPKMDGQEMHLIAAFDTLRVMIEDCPTIIPADKENENE